MIVVDETGYNSLEHLGACSMSCAKHLACPSGLEESSPDVCAFKGRPYVLVGDPSQHSAPGGHPVYFGAAKRLDDPRYVPVSDDRGERPAKLQRSTTRQGKGYRAVTAEVTGPTAQPPPRPSDEKLRHGFKVYRDVEDVFVLTEQQRQDTSQGGRDLQASIELFNGESEPHETLIEQFVDTMNAKAVPTLDDLHTKQVRFVVQRNAPRHRLNTRALQHDAVRQNCRLIVWNAAHTPVRRRGHTIPLPLSEVEQMCALRTPDSTFDGVTADTWYFPGALYTLLDSPGPDAGACRNRLVRAVGIILDPREEDDDLEAPVWRLKYMPTAVFVKPVGGGAPTSLLDGAKFVHDDLDGAFPVLPRDSSPADVFVPCSLNGKKILRLKRRNVPLGDAYAVTDFFVQGASFGSECWIIDLVPPRGGLKRAALYVLLSRYRSMDDVRLLRPLYYTVDKDGRKEHYGRKVVIRAFNRAARCDPDLTAEWKLLREAAAKSRNNRHSALFAKAERLVAERTNRDV